MFHLFFWFHIMLKANMHTSKYCNKNGIDLFHFMKNEKKGTLRAKFDEISIFPRHFCILRNSMGIYQTVIMCVKRWVRCAVDQNGAHDWREQLPLQTESKITRSQIYRLETKTMSHDNQIIKPTPFSRNEMWCGVINHIYMCHICAKGI